ncbi:ABSCISIC ACID-INSENSITIVE 5-like protein 5 [Rhynchospora pubera]|uniref:ABSCISIC ACID-INSENSITIVE 5-like protein 5 n=1 Tax=Rhynchospora pubera TaxID=906938 RepID=A0AAV8D8N6_9POAL|nr:ABSCISIC ACID-INSENSITIVE 5-like protein 5 [Rhynchospora pubera]KAJ4764369.1 ABSCISIC ACID-INSENSITIVE 5-like protein 5 [Rhynchospora pubera]KAJ4793257.1 ABSCISIC ACID-INSENSITIVE 5-like protein 5 [Rhynchospora pubera]
MVTQAMTSQGIGTGMASLSRQSSIYSLTLNEVQSHLGEPLHSMNLDDLLRFSETGDSQQLRFERSPATINRQGSVNMPSPLSKKTVDEVWRDIQTSVQRHLTLGEMTLEDFLSKAGAVGGSVGSVQQGGFIGNYVGRPVPRPVGVGTGQILDVMYRDGGGSITALSPVTPARKRAMATVEDMAEKTVERRQKRMIKNRESAARSRARKQAYTNELENKITRLEEEIERLKEEKKSMQEAQQVQQPEPKYPMRRINSCSF